jgi:hypothetical protein
MQSLFDTLGKLLLEFTWRRLASVVLMAALAISAVALYERYTSSFQLARIEKVANILATLHAIDPTQLDGRPELRATYLDLVTQVNAAARSRPLLPELSATRWVPTTVGKVIGGGILWWLLALLAFRDVLRKDNNARVALPALLVLGLGAGLVALTVDGGGIAFHFVLYPLLSFVLPVLLMLGIGLYFQASGDSPPATPPPAA